MRMETLEYWEAEWSVGEPTSCCFVDHETTSSSSLAEHGSGRVRAAASASLCELLPQCEWRAISAADQQPTCKKRKRDPDPDPVAQHLIGSGSENPPTSDIKVTTNNNNRTISFKQKEEGEDEDGGEADTEAIQQMKEMIYRAAAFRPVNLGVEAGAEKPRRKNVRISTDPQTVAARQRRERISDRLRLLQKLVPGGSKMDTASMLDEAANYLKFLRSQVNALQAMPLPLPLPTTNGYYFSHLLLQHQHYTKTKSS